MDKIGDVQRSFCKRFRNFGEFARNVKLVLQVTFETRF